MRFFLVHGTYLFPFSELTQLGALAEEHRAFVKQGYDNGDFLFSGPEVPADSGILVVRAESREKLDELMAKEPFIRDGKVRVSRVVEFDPVKHQDVLRNWVNME